MNSKAPAPSADLNFGFLWRHKFILFACGVVGAVLGGAYLYVVPPTYQAQSRVLIAPQGITIEVEQDNYAQPEFLPTQAETIRSPLTIARALETVSIARPRGVTEEEFDPVRHVLKSLQATPVLKANVLTISYQSTDPVEAVELISAVIASYRENVAAVDKGTWATNVQVIAARERELRNDLLAMQADYAKLRAASPLVSDGRDGANVALAQLNELSTHLSATRLRRVEIESRLTSLNTAVAAITGQPLDQEARGSASTGRTSLVALKPVSPTLNATVIDEVLNYSEPEDARKIEELAKNLRFAKLKVEQFDSVYGEKHPDLIAARAEAAEHELLLHERLRTIASTWESELTTLADTEQRLQVSYDAERKAAKNIDSYLVTDQSLQSNIKKMEELHSATLAQLMSMQSADKALAEGRHSVEVRILEAPQLLDEMAWPKPKPLLAASTILGILAGFCMVWLRANGAN